MGTTGIGRDSALGASVVISVVSLVLLLGATWYFQSSLNLLQQQVEYDRKLLLELQHQIKVSMKATHITIINFVLSSGSI